MYNHHEVLVHTQKKSPDYPELSHLKIGDQEMELTDVKKSTNQADQSGSTDPLIIAAATSKAGPEGGSSRIFNIACVLRGLCTRSIRIQFDIT